MTTTKAAGKTAAPATTTLTAPLEQGRKTVFLPIDRIIIGEQQIRDLSQADDAIDELALDIQAHGMLQPIGVHPLADDRYQLLWGSRRIAAHRRLNRHTIEATIIDQPDRGIRATALAENLQRRQLSVAEECEAVTEMNGNGGMSPAQIAASLSRSRAWVMTRLEIPQYAAEIQDALIDGRLPLGCAQELARLPANENQSMLMQHAIAGRWTRTQTRQAVEQMLTLPDVSAAVEAGIEARDNPQPQPQLLATCAMCGTTHPLDQLALVRICRSGCPTPTTTTTED